MLHNLSIVFFIVNETACVRILNMNMKQKIKVGILGATGVAGQQFISALANHPWFQIKGLAASEKNVGKEYGALIDENKIHFSNKIPENSLKLIAGMKIQHVENFPVKDIDLVFSALPTEIAQKVELQYAQHVPVFSTASAYRMEKDVPLILPGLNLEHFDLLTMQRKNRGWRGGLVALPNCTATGLVISLKPILDRFGLKKVLMTSMQACSGAGRSPGVLAIDILDNIIPYIPSEEEKVERETQKILGLFDSSTSQIVASSIPISCTCTRVPVIDGHTEVVYVETETPVSTQEAMNVFEQFGHDFLALDLPSSPTKMIKVHRDLYRPQVRLDREEEGGMVTHVGRVRQDFTIGNYGLKYVLVSHNSKLGAAHGAVWAAEYAISKGYFR